MPPIWQQCMGQTPLLAQSFHYLLLSKIHNSSYVAPASVNAWLTCKLRRAQPGVICRVEPLVRNQYGTKSKTRRLPRAGLLGEDECAYNGRQPYTIQAT